MDKVVIDTKSNENDYLITFQGNTILVSKKNDLEKVKDYFEKCGNVEVIVK